MPALEAQQDRLARAHTQSMGISVDSRHCHANWAVSLGGVSFPLLQDFHPKGQMAASYGLYLEQAGITDRATVIVDASGVVRFVASVGAGGERNIDELVQEAERIDAEHGQGLPDNGSPLGIPPKTTLYVKSSCGFSLAVLNACNNLGLQKGRISIKNVSEDPAAAEELERLTGTRQAPCLVVEGQPKLESGDIIQELVTRTTGFWS